MTDEKECEHEWEFMDKDYKIQWCKKCYIMKLYDGISEGHKRISKELLDDLGFVSWDDVKEALSEKSEVKTPIICKTCDEAVAYVEEIKSQHDDKICNEFADAKYKEGFKKGVDSCRCKEHIGDNGQETKWVH